MAAPTVRDKIEGLGERIRQLREERGWTQAELAARLESNQAYLSKLERDARSMSARMFRDLARVFGVKLDDLLPVDESSGKKIFKKKVHKCLTASVQQCILKV